MKNKKLTYTLLIFVALIWGGIIYQIIPKNNNEFNEKKIITHSSDSEIVNDEYSIHLNYIDPFLNAQFVDGKKKNSHYLKTRKALRNDQVKQLSKNNTTINANNKRFTQNKQDNSKTKWPLIKYAGLVDERGLFVLNNRGVIVKKGEVINEINFEYFCTDSAVVKYQGEEKVLKK